MPVMRKLYFYYLILFCFIYITGYRQSLTIVDTESTSTFQSTVVSYDFSLPDDSVPPGQYLNTGPLFLLMFNRPRLAGKSSSQKSRLNYNYAKNLIRRKFRPAWIYITSISFLLLFYFITLFLANMSPLGLTFPGLLFFEIVLTVNIFIIIIGLTYLHWMYEKKQKIAQLKTQRHQSNLYEIQQRQQQEEIKLLRLQNELQVQRERLARDLHDGIGSQLTHIVTKLDMLSIRSAQARQLVLLSDFARETNQILRETIWVLNHNYIEYTQFQQRMSGFMNRLWEDKEQPELKISMSEHSTLLISPVVAMTIFRIGQEVINNALKYANADCIEILFRQKSNTIVVEMGDNGSGFDLQKVKRGYGLDNIQKRCSELGGQLALYSAPNGTIVIIELPPSESKSS